MELLRTTSGLLTLGTVLVGLLIFGLAPHLPTLFPPSITRFVGFFTILSAVITIRIETESWLIPALVGIASLLVMGGIHVIQTRRNA